MPRTPAPPDSGKGLFCAAAQAHDGSQPRIQWYLLHGRNEDTAHLLRPLNLRTKWTVAHHHAKPQRAIDGHMTALSAVCPWHRFIYILVLRMTPCAGLWRRKKLSSGEFLCVGIPNFDLMLHISVR